MFRLIKNYVLLVLVIFTVSSCKQLSSGSELPPVEIGNVALSPDDQPPVETTGQTYRLVIPKEEPEAVDYSGLQN